ncbi:polyketide synthase PksM [Favolaschia claudopus]|uniref:Polyketide synthase PksM n=1 Tax=Favolaschia claudopus TaxID=2862362 RepID=A0AAV9ZLX9_9AGAR
MSSVPQDVVDRLGALDLYDPKCEGYETDGSVETALSDPPDSGDERQLEDGEIADDNEKQAKNYKRSLRRTERRKGDSNRKAEELRKAQRTTQETLAPILGVVADEIHIHMVRRDLRGLERLREREKGSGTRKPGSLTHDDVNELIKVDWMFEPGIHIGYLSEKGKEQPTIVFMVKIKPWDSLQVETRNEFQQTLQTVMDWSQCTYAIKNNAAMKSPADHAEESIVVVAPRGTMVGIGWHASMEPGKTLVNYAPADKSEDGIDEYRRLNKRLPELAELYRQEFAGLFPAGMNHMQAFSDANAVASFGDILDGDAKQRPFANSLTATLNEFCNFQHMDKDAAPVAFGMWWEAQKLHGEWTFTPDADHARTTGGGFLWGAYGAGVDFARARGLVEIYWRGQLDWHGTLVSKDQDEFTRFGTSIQLTERGVRAMRSVWDVDQLAASGHDIHQLAPKSAARITTAADRIAKAGEQRVGASVSNTMPIIDLPC